MKWFKKLFLQNLFVKILALILAVFTYLYIHREDISEKVIKDVDVKVTGLHSSTGWRVVTIDVEKMDLVLVGPRQKIEVRNNRNVFIALPFEDVDFKTKGEKLNKTFKITEEMIRGISYDIKLKHSEKEPTSVTVEAALYTTKKLNVVLDIRGKPAPEYEVKWKTYSPNIVDVTGPEYVIKYEESIPTNPIDIGGESKVVDLDVGLNTDYLKEKKGVRFECNSKVYVNVGIKPLPKEKKFTGIPVAVLKTQNKIWTVKTDPATINVTVIGNVDELKKLEKPFIKAYIDADDLLGPGKTKMGVKFFIKGSWETIRVKDDVTVNVDVSVLGKQPK